MAQATDLHVHWCVKCRGDRVHRVYIEGDNRVTVKTVCLACGWGEEKVC